MPPEQKADAQKDAAKTVSDVSQLNHNEGSAKAAERLQQDFQDYAKNNATDPEAVKTYWDNVNKGLKDNGTLTPLSLEFAKNNMNKVDNGDGDVTPASIKEKMSRNQDVMDFVADAKLPQFAGRRFDLMMQQELSEKMTSGRDGGNWWVDRDREMDKGDFTNRLNDIDKYRKEQLNKEGMRASFPNLLDSEDGTSPSPFYKVLDTALENGNKPDNKIDDNDIDAYIEKANKQWEENKRLNPNYEVPLTYDPAKPDTKWNQAWMTEAKELQKKFNDLDDDAMFGDLITTESLRSSLGYGSEAEMWADGKKRNAPPTSEAPVDGAKPTEPAKEGEPAKPVEAAKPTEPAKEGEPAKPVEAAKPTEPAKEGEPAKPKDPKEAAADELTRRWVGLPQAIADKVEGVDHKFSASDFEAIKEDPSLTLEQRAYAKDMAANFEAKFGAKEISREDLFKLSGNPMEEAAAQRDIAASWTKAISQFKADANGSITTESLDARVAALTKENADPATAGDAGQVQKRNDELAAIAGLKKNFGWFATKEGVITDEDMKNYARNNSATAKAVTWEGFKKDAAVAPSAEEQPPATPGDAPPKAAEPAKDAAALKAEQEAALDKAANDEAAKKLAEVNKPLQLNKDGNVLYDIAQKSLQMQKDAGMYSGSMDHADIMRESVRIAIANGLIDEKYRGGTKIPESSGIAGKIKRNMTFKLYSDKESAELQKQLADKYKDKYNNNGG